MQLIYIHGLNSSANAMKGTMLRDFCQQHRPEIQVECPDLNLPPQLVVEKLQELIAQDAQTALIGSSLGGFFATYLSNLTGCRAALLNPSTRPSQSLRRLCSADWSTLPKDEVFYTTAGGWQMCPADLDWFAQHRPSHVVYPNRVLVLLQTGDEKLDYRVAQQFFSQEHAHCYLYIEPNGNHRMTNFADNIPFVLNFLFDNHANG